MLFSPHPKILQKLPNRNKTKLYPFFLPHFLSTVSKSNSPPNFIAPLPIFPICGFQIQILYETPIISSPA